MAVIKAFPSHEEGTVIGPQNNAGDPQNAGRRSLWKASLGFH